MNIMITAIALETRTNFLFEEWSEPYLQYGEVNTAQEKSIIVQEALQSLALCAKANKGGAWL